MYKLSRRRFIAGVSVAGAGLLTGACSKKDMAGDITAAEDLMREHGVLRRALLVYEETAHGLRGNPTPKIAEALQKTANLFRTFGEDYHEKKLEEAYIFPILKKGDVSMASLIKTLITQHDRGRQITDYVLTVTQHGKIETNRRVEIAMVLENFVLMYQNHAAREDTVIFPSWKQALSAEEIDEMGDKFEDIEHEQFGEDGFEKAVQQITEIEAELGLADLGQFTVQIPPNL